MIVALRPSLERSLALQHDDTLIDLGGGATAVDGEVSPGAPIAVSLWARDGALDGAALRCAPDGEEELHPMEVVERAAGRARWVCTIRPRVERLRYRFRLERPGGVLHLGMVGLSPIDPVDAFDFTLLAGARPAWPLDAVLYQIFPDRFDDGDAASNVRDGQWSLRGASTRARRFGDPPLSFREAGNLDFYGGDLAGVERRIDHLARLGVSGLFLNPIWPALSNHRYDLLDHGRVDPHLGGDGALASLAAALHARDMRLVLDVVLNHTGSGHPWFNREGLFGDGGAWNDPAAPERDFYLFDEWPHRYRAWMGIDTLPRLNLGSPALRARLVESLGRFLRPPFLVDGYRFDVANMMGRDGAEQFHRPLWTELSSSLRRERGEAWLVGEHFFDPDKLLKGDGLDGVMAYHAFTFPLRAWLLGRDRRGAPSAIDAADLVALWRASWARAGFSAWRRSSLHVNTHDIPRLQSEGDARALDVATAIQLALPGVPCLYYGDEIGMAGGADPDNRRCMEWDESRWDRARLGRTTDLVKRRRGSPALRRGGFVDLGSAGDVLAFARPLGDRTAVLVATRSREPITVRVPIDGLPGARSPTIDVGLDPMSARIVELA